MDDTDRQRCGNALPKRAGLLSITVAICTLWTFPATAQEGTVESFQLETLDLGSSSTSIYGVDTAGVTGHLVPTVDVWLHRVQRPFDLGSESIVDHRWTLVFGGGFGLTDRLQLDAHLPIVVNQAGPGLLRTDGIDSSATGDIRLGAKYLVWDGDAYRVGLTATMWTESGSIDGLVSNHVVRGEPGFVADVSLGRALVSVNAGYQFRRAREFAAYRHDDALRWGAATRVPLVADLGLEASLFGEWAPASDTSNALPVEALGGAYWQRDGVRVSLGGGAGLNRSVGSPRYRLAAGVAYSPGRDDATGRAVGPPDHDQDGLVGAADQCPRAAETFDGFEDYDGCPDLDDDGDGVADVADACPGVAGIVRKSGCPLFDVDGDSVDDAVDGCPREPEDIDGDTDSDGCPEEEARRAQPTCPPGGCEEETTTVQSTEPLRRNLFFGTDSTDFQPERAPLLDEITVLMRDPSIDKVVIEGHTDARGSEEHNRRLSLARASAVRDVLLDRGVDPSRIETKGAGESKPVATNDTVEGRARNRRVEFRLHKKENIPVGDDPEKMKLTLASFEYDRRDLLVEDPLRFIEGSRLNPLPEHLCRLNREHEETLVLSVGDDIAVTGTSFPGRSATQTIACILPDGESASLAVAVEIPGFALAGGGIRGDRIQMARGGHTVLEIQYSGRALPIDVSAPGLQTTVVPITRDRARLLLVDDGASDETQLTLAVGDRDILDVPVDIVDTHSVAPPVDRVNFELGLGSAIIGPIQIAGTTAESGGIVSSVRYTARILASEWFSAGLVGDVGPLLGADPVLFMPGVGFEGVVHAPWERFRPFVSAGFESWFPGLDRAWPALEGSVGVDWEPDEGAGVRAAARAVVLTDQGEPMVVPGGFLGVFTSFR